MLVVLVCVGVALVACILFANVTIFGLVYHSFHVMDAPVEGLGANLFLFWFIFLWWNLFPLLVLFLKTFV